MLKKTIAIVLCAAMLFAFSGCHMFVVNDEKDAAQVVGSVFGQDVIKSDVLAKYDEFVTDYQSYYSKDPSSEEREYYLELLLDQELDTIVKEKKAEELELAVTEAEIAEIDKSIADQKEQLETSIRTSVEEKAKTDATIDVETEVKKQLEEALTYYGMSDDTYKNNQITSKRDEKLKSNVVKDVAVTDEEVQAKYDSLLETQKEALDNNAGASVTGTAVYNAPNRRYVKNLLIMIPEATRTEIAAITDETEKATRQAAELAKLEEKANDVLTQLKGGADFDKLLEQYGEDTGMKQDPAKTQGYLIYTGNTSYVSEFVTAGMALEKIGDFSELVASSYGYHIIQYASDAPSGAIPFESVKEDVKAETLSEKQDALWTETIDAWEKEGNLQKHTDRLFM